MDKNDRSVSYIAYESEMARHERTEKRLIGALALSVTALFISIIKR